MGGGETADHRAAVKSSRELVDACDCGLLRTYTRGLVLVKVHEGHLAK